MTGEEFISHLIVKHNFLEQKGPPQKTDFGSQAGLGTVSWEQRDITPPA